MSFLIVFPLSASNNFLFLAPTGLPSVLPSDLSLARASFVRWAIKALSISADNPKAKANTLEEISEPKR